MRRHAWRALWVLALVLAPAGCIVPYSYPYYSSYSAGYPAGYAPGYGPDGVSFDVFYSELDPYGDWVQVSGLGWVWRPSVAIVGPGFRPYYTGGRWVYTSWGWQFQSIWGWGATTFHYGRWGHDPFHGWVWVPGYEWGPAWVSWRNQGGYVAWAPLPPPGFGFSAGIVWHSVPRQRFYRSWVDHHPSHHERVHRINEPGRVTRVVPDRPVPVQPRRLEPGMQPRTVVPAPQRVRPYRPSVQQQRPIDPGPQHLAPPRAVAPPAGQRIDMPRPHVQPRPHMQQGHPSHGGRPNAGQPTRPAPHRGH